MHKSSYTPLLPSTKPKTSDDSTFIDIDINKELEALEAVIQIFKATCSKEVIYDKKLFCGSIISGHGRIKCDNIIEYFKLFCQNSNFGKHCTAMQIQKFYELWNSFHNIAVGTLSHPLACKNSVFNLNIMAIFMFNNKELIQKSIEETQIFCNQRLQLIEHMDSMIKQIIISITIDQYEKSSLGPSPKPRP